MMRSLLALLVLASPAIADEDVFLSVGPGGQRMLAPDGRSWERHVAWGEPKHDQNDLNVATFFKGTAYVGGGFSIARMTATRDGKTWSEGALPKGSPVFGLEVLNDTLYVVTLRGQVYKSRDGERFAQVGAAEMPTRRHWIRSTAAGNGIILGSGDFGPVIAFDPTTEKIVVSQMAGQKDKNATLIRTAFGNGMFVVGGQDGLLAASKDGVAWKNNEVHSDRGTVSAVVWTGTQFIAAAKNGALASANGLDWKKLGVKVPRKMVRAGGWLYGWAWPPHKLQRSRDGLKWEDVPNEKQYYVKHVAFGTLAGKGAPPTFPEWKRKK